MLAFYDLFEYEIGEARLSVGGCSPDGGKPQVQYIHSGIIDATEFRTCVEMLIAMDAGLAFCFLMGHCYDVCLALAFSRVLKLPLV